jgi:hypothetical protein
MSQAKEFDRVFSTFPIDVHQMRRIFWVFQKIRKVNIWANKNTEIPCIVLMLPYTEQPLSILVLTYVMYMLGLGCMRGSLYFYVL